MPLSILGIFTNLQWPCTYPTLTSPFLQLRLDMQRPLSRFLSFDALPPLAAPPQLRKIGCSGHCGVMAPYCFQHDLRPFAFLFTLKYFLDCFKY
jgi:hypothetical protein